MFEAMSVKGEDADPLYRMLANKIRSSAQVETFFKYLMDKKWQTSLMPMHPL